MQKISKNILLTSLLLSLFVVTGYAVSNYHNINILYKGIKNISLTILAFVVLVIAFYLLISLIFHILDKSREVKFTSKLGKFIFEKHAILKLFLIFFIVGIPILVIYYPGPIHWDGLQQLDYFYGIHEWTNHHPVVPTIIMGLFVKLGRFLINDNFGAFLFNFVQYNFSCFVFAYTINFLHQIKTPKWLVISIFLFFLINPLWYIHAYTLVKDTYFYLFFMLYLIAFIKYLYSNSKWPFILSAIPLILFRNNGIHIVILTLIIVGLFRKDKRVLNCILVLFFACFQIVYNYTLEVFNIPQSNIREMLSVPIQQTARYIKKYDLTKEELKVYQSVFIISMDEIKKEYDPELSDPIKFSFYAEKDTIGPYFEMWLKDFFKHPKVYFDAFLENYYGYIYPPKREFKDGLAWFIVVKNEMVNTGYFDFKMLNKFKPARKCIEENIQKVRELPIIEFLFNTGFYTYVLIIMLSYAIHKNKKEYFLVAMPIILALAFCFLSPVNAYIRYMNPIIVTIPILIGVITNQNKDKFTNLK